MNTEICLVIIYNHNYEKNISVLDRVYQGRFTSVYHVMPFYTGNTPNVIGVYENSYQFSGYIAQALPRLRKNRFSHYVFVADDMVLNPTLNENNIIAQMKLGEADSFISNYHIIDDVRFMNWISAIPSAMNLMGGGNSCEWRRFLPGIEDARRCFDRHGCDWRGGISDRLYRVIRRGCMVMGQTPGRYKLIPPLKILKKYPRLLESKEKIYPLAEGYSDMVVVPSDAIDFFCQYCGVFAAVRVFVEIAIPTALLFCCKSIKTLSATGWRAENGIDDYRVRQKLEDDAQMSYAKLIDDFPADFLFVHPIKLSKWKDLP